MKNIICSIIIPVGFEYDGLDKCLKSILKSDDSNNYEVLVGIDEGDIKNEKIIDEINSSKIRRVIWRGEQGYAYMHEKSNELALKAWGDVIWWLSDECRIITKNWTEILKKELKNNAMVMHPITIPQDGSKHPMVSRDWVEATGKFAGFPSIDSWINTVRERSGVKWKQIEITVQEIERDPEQTRKGKMRGSNEFWETEEVENRMTEDAEKLKPRAIFEIVHSTKPMAQFVYELVRFIELLQGLKPKVIITIGVAWGGVEYCLKGVFPGTEVIGIDIGNPAIDPNYHLRDVNIKELYRCDSTKKSTLTKLKKILRGRKADALFIDGDHHYDYVKSDWKMYSPLVRKGGIVAFHDIKDTQAHKDNNVEVPKFWKELKKHHNTEELCEFEADRYGGDWGGIGVIYK